MVLTAAECRARADQKLAQAKHDKQHSRKHLAAAAAWFLFGNGTAEVERRSRPAMAEDPANA